MGSNPTLSASHTAKTRLSARFCFPLTSRYRMSFDSCARPIASTLRVPDCRDPAPRAGHPDLPERRPGGGFTEQNDVCQER
ncbi:MAG TPA: hypothetical protein PLH41_11755, partial [Accumulibacter sp.]|nr:hypothetical protein [Accumulibacter sp.]